MADFCLQCNIDHYFGPYSDFDHLSEAYKDDELRFGMLCEGCGLVLVDRHGVCRDPKCDLHNEKCPPERREAYEKARRWVERRSGPLGRLLRLRDAFLGTPWEPGHVHFSPFWTRARILWHDLISGETVAHRFLWNREQRGLYPESPIWEEMDL